MTLARPLVRADWDRVVVYSTQVRRITEPFSILDNATGRAINPSDIAAVASAAFVANLFPCLSYAFFALDATEQSAHFPSIAMVPSLRRTVWHISNSPSTPIPMEPVLQLFTRFIRNCSLQITSLELHGCIYSAVEQLLYPSLTQFAHLIHLTLNTAGGNAHLLLPSLGQLRHLATLQLAIHYYVADSSKALISKIGPNTVGSALHQLDLRVPALAILACYPFLISSNARLESLKVNFQGFTPQDTTVSFTQLVSDIAVCSQLQSLEIGESHCMGPPKPDPADV
ncbi:hypothetical protein BDV98DRAFT_58796 [Pterulicium gracile]|uniref:F-box domain-containing protein n=1 Tax=Pterulicium gracile TaxID=1884261 RepID=A0A5C3Q278_9AGAR|nr:hypothetical protein BDV98DRAFT_58796 [Pterula gracilis]